MGVKDLWQVLSPVCERKSLWELQDKTVAIDLSGWVCDSQNIAEHSSQPNMHLRNLFFRTSCLLLLGARPVFVLEGDAPELKLNIMTQRNVARGFSQSSKNSGKRTRYKSIQKKCEEMLKTMGVNCIQSNGEAEALCALLNEKGMVYGCISQDSDCFLYGGQVVFRNFTISASSGGGGGQGFSIDMYRMKQIEELLGLSRMKLIGLSLLCGCDYNQGVSGVGKETAVKFLNTLDDAEVISRFHKWRNEAEYERLEKERSDGVCDWCSHFGKKKLHDKNGCELCGTTKKCHNNLDPDALIHRNPEEQKMIINELNIRRKALQDETFPSQDVIDEFTRARPVPKALSVEWSQPNLIGFMTLAEKHLKWDQLYSLEKFLPVLTRWLVLQNPSTGKCPIFPEEIVKTRVLKGVSSYEVRWSDREGLFETLITEDGSHICLTIEPKELFQRAFPMLVKEFNDREEAKKLSKQKGKSKTTKGSKRAKVTHTCSSCGKDLPSKNQKCLCLFVTNSSSKKDEKSSTGPLEDVFDSMSLHPVCSNKQEKKHLAQNPQQSKLMKNCERLKKLLSDSDLSPLTQDDFKREYNKCPENASSSQSKHPSAPSIKQTTKFSFETYLKDEEWSEADFAEEEEGDLSDIVQSITGTYKKEPLLPVSQEETTVATKSTGKVSVQPQVGDESSEEEAPYTPLIERVRKMQEIRGGKTTSAATSMKLRRLSESFTAFCVGDNATSSPIANSNNESTCIDFPGVSFSLGITNLLENTE